ncbi:HNH endonuclease [Arthrobacter phage Lewando]|nr:HNH endonuclease [Arthrobacter phage Lewando]
MLINIDNADRTLQVLDALLAQKYRAELEAGIHSWLNEVKAKVQEGQQTEYYRDTWRRLTEFPQYEINGVGEIRHRTDEDLIVEPIQGVNGDTYVRLTKSRGIFTLNVQHLINKEFPEIKA